MTFVSLAQSFHALISYVIREPLLHAKWLNTLSYLENCGAKKIAACQHPTLVREEVLKHAAEEFRHAHYLKHQIERVSTDRMDTYALSFMLGGVNTLHYLHALDMQTSRYLRGVDLSCYSLKEAAYLLVTYAIERRAEELYPIYDQILRTIRSRVTVRSILLEEQGHLQEMRKGLEKLPSGYVHAEQICAIESALCEEWVEGVLNTLRTG